MIIIKLQYTRKFMTAYLLKKSDRSISVYIFLALKGRQHTSPGQRPGKIYIKF